MKAELAEIALLEKKGTLISRELAAAQVGYLLTCFRQRVVAEPGALAGRLVAGGFVDEKRAGEVQEMIRGELYAMLTELAELPQRVTDPDWIERIDADYRSPAEDGERLPPMPAARGA